MMIELTANFVVKKAKTVDEMVIHNEKRETFNVTREYIMAEIG